MKSSQLLASEDKSSTAPKSQEPPKRWEILRILLGTKKKIRLNRSKKKKR